MNTKQNAIVAVVLILLLFLGVTVVADNALRGARIDLTENRLYTLSPATKKIVGRLDEPIKLTFFFSETTAAGRPALQAYAKRVRELLEEYELRAGGMITLEILDPEPFSEAEERAQRAGIVSIPIGQGESLYFGLVGTNSTDGREVVPFFDPSEERFLEYSLSRLVHKLAVSKRPVVALISTLPLEGMRAPNAPPEMTRPWAVMNEIRSLFDVRPVPDTATEIPPGVDLLLVIHPKPMLETLKMAIDDYVIAGGPAIFCIDPLCESDIPPEALQNPQMIFSADRSSNIPDLLGAWGISLEEEKIVVDIDHALRGPTRDGTTVSYVQYLSLPADLFDDDDAVTGGLATLNMAAVGSLRHDPDAGTTWTPLVRSGERSATIDASRLTFFADPTELVAGYEASGGPRVIAGRLTGRARSAFAANVVDDSAEGEESDGATDLSSGEGDINVIVIADCDFLANRYWAQEMPLGGRLLGYQKYADNADLIVNAMDNLAGASDLIELRASGTFARPFTLVQEIQREAEQEYLAEAQALEEQRRTTQQRIRELQQQRPDASDLILTSEQQEEIERFREQLASTNAQLRDVRFSLRKDVEALGDRLRITNTLLAPAIVALGAVGLGAYRTVRRRHDRRTMAGQG